MKRRTVLAAMLVLTAGMAAPAISANAAKPKKPTAKKPWKYSGKTSQGQAMTAKWNGKTLQLKTTITGPCTSNREPVAATYTIDGVAELAKAGKYKLTKFAPRRPAVAEDESAVSTTSGKLSSKSVTVTIKITAETEGNAPCQGSSATATLKRK